jgi:O-antigen ligase
MTATTIGRVQQFPTHGLARALALSVLVASGLVDIPRAVSLGSITAQAALTIFYFCTGAILVLLTPTKAPILSPKTIGLIAFWCWAATSLLWTTDLWDGIQNIMVIGTLLLMMALAEAAASARPSFALWLEKQFLRSILVASLLYLASVIWSGAGTNDLISARSFGLYADFGVAACVSKWRHGSRRYLLAAAALTVLIGVSESRLALGIALALFPLSQLPTKNMLRAAKMAAMIAFTAACAYGAITYFDSLYERFFSGDVSLKIGSVAINGSGRTAFWKVTIDSFQESPVIGKGAGSAEALIEAFFVDINHPHSDYLRIAHDYGIIGASLWAFGFIAMLISLWRSWRRAEALDADTARLQTTALMALAAFAMQMTVENALVYVFVAASLGLLVGSALGIYRARIELAYI